MKLASTQIIMPIPSGSCCFLRYGLRVMQYDGISWSSCPLFNVVCHVLFSCGSGSQFSKVLSRWRESERKSREKSLSFGWESSNGGGKSMEMDLNHFPSISFHLEEIFNAPNWGSLHELVYFFPLSSLNTHPPAPLPNYNILNSVRLHLLYGNKSIICVTSVEMFLYRLLVSLCFFSSCVQPLYD